MTSLRRRFLQHLVALSAWRRPAAAAQPAPAPASPARQPGRLGGYILGGVAEHLHREFDIVIVGGGLAGTCAAIAASRNGAKVALVHERSMLGGNSSSEVRLFPENSCNHNIWCKETGILDEFHTEERARNHEPYIEGQMNCHWDLVLYDWVRREPNLSLYLNTTMREVEMKDPGHILAVHAVQLGTEREFTFTAPLFIDCTGDGVLGHRAGAEYRWGKEARSEFHEDEAPEQPSDAVMGSTLFFRARDAGRPVPFQRPAWAAEFLSEADLLHRSHARVEAGYWWIEVGHPLHPIRDNEEVKHEGLRQLLGIWDHLKNRCVHRGRAANFNLEFVGFWPYKREARRLMGDYILRQQDVQNPQPQRDAIAFGCWNVDIHKPGGILARSEPTYPSLGDERVWENTGAIVYGIPLRGCYSRNVENLMFAGRPISASYCAFSSARVLRTGAIVGQGVGTAAALCRRYRVSPRQLGQQRIRELQQLLLRQDAFLPGVENEDPGDLARTAEVSASSMAALDFPESSEFGPLRTRTAQLFPVSSERLDTVELLLESRTARPVTLTAGLRLAAAVYDLRGDRDLATASATVPPGHRGWIPFRFNLAVKPGSLYYLHLPATPDLGWALYTDPADGAALSPAGTTAADMPGPSRWRPLWGGKNFCLRLTPRQYPYAAANVVRGTNRPDRWTNLWISDPREGLPAWIELRFPRPIQAGEIQLTFDTDINRHSRQPLFRYPDCVREYVVDVREQGAWRTVAHEADNYYRRRVHRFPPATTERLRVAVRRTHGADSARLYEIRVYAGT